MIKDFLILTRRYIFVDVHKADAGNLTCEVNEKIKEGDKWVRDELVAIKSVPIKVRGKKTSNLQTFTKPFRKANGRI